MGLIGEATDHGNILPKIWMSKETWPRFLVHPESTKRLFWDCLACVPAANHWIRLPLKHHTQNKNKRTIRLYLEMVYAQWWQFIREDDINQWVWGCLKNGHLRHDALHLHRCSTTGSFSLWSGFRGDVHHVAGWKHGKTMGLSELNFLDIAAQNRSWMNLAESYLRFLCCWVSKIIYLCQTVSWQGGLIAGKHRS